MSDRQCRLFLNAGVLTDQCGRVEKLKKSDRAALKVHYVKHHQIFRNIDLSEAFTVTFIDQPHNPKDLDVVESSWIYKLKASININRTVLPLIR